MPQTWPDNRIRMRVTLLGIAASAAIAWGLILPRLAETLGISHQLQELEAQGIAADAMFYSDHPATFR